ncbi:MAG: hypothetical protein ACOZBW_06800 [Thermodesulfobacteriota bacterium]
MLKYLAAGAVFLGCVILASPVLAHLSVLETGQMQEMTGAAGICVPAVENACADKPAKSDALLSDSERIKEVESALKAVEMEARTAASTKKKKNKAEQEEIKAEVHTAISITGIQQPSTDTNNGPSQEEMMAALSFLVDAASFILSNQQP